MAQKRSRAERDVAEMGRLLDILEGAVAQPDESIEDEDSMTGCEMQRKYARLRVHLNQLRTESAALSSRKVHDKVR